MQTCTWKGCTRPGTKPQTGMTGQRWSVLCAEHDLQLEAAVRSTDMKAVMKAWIDAQGGPAAAAQRMKRAAEVGARLINQLSLLKP